MSAGTSPTQCEADFPNIVSCMADGRDHLPCCLDQGIPGACSDLCRGEYTVQTDNIKSLFSCSAYTAPTLACIAVGVGQSCPAFIEESEYFFLVITVMVQLETTDKN